MNNKVDEETLARYEKFQFKASDEDAPMEKRSLAHLCASSLLLEQNHIRATDFAALNHLRDYNNVKYFEVQMKKKRSKHEMERKFKTFGGDIRALSAEEIFFRLPYLERDVKKTVPFHSTDGYNPFLSMSARNRNDLRITSDVNQTKKQENFNQHRINETLNRHIRCGSSASLVKGTSNERSDAAQLDLIDTMDGVSFCPASTLTSKKNSKYQMPEDRIAALDKKDLNSSYAQQRKFQVPRKISAVDKIDQLNSENSTRRGIDSSGKDAEEKLPPELNHCDLETIKKIEKEMLINGDAVKFDDIAGLDDAKQSVRELVIWPMLRPELFTGMRTLPKGLLLFGPPGTGKTLIGKAIAHESGATFFSISSSSLMSKWIGEGEKLVRALFALAAYKQPSVIFVDEVDSMLCQRSKDESGASRRLLTELLLQLDGVGTKAGDRVIHQCLDDKILHKLYDKKMSRILFIGATNRPQELDEAARRRFSKRIHIPLPNRAGREQLLRTLLEKNKSSLSDEDIETIVVRTEGFSGADLSILCAEAAMEPLRNSNKCILEIDLDDVPPISFEHFDLPLKSVHASVSQEETKQYFNWNALYGYEIKR